MRKTVSTRKHSVTPPDWDLELMAVRFHSRRKGFGWTIEELARRAQVSRFTILRLEKGMECSYPTITKVRGALMFFSEQLTKSFQQQKGVFVSRAKENRWMLSQLVNRRGKVLRSKDLIYVDDEAERRRLGGLGFQKFFTCIPKSEDPQGVICHCLMELYARTPFDRHFGEELIYCLDGEVEMIVDGESTTLQVGDSMVFDAWTSHSYGPAKGHASAKILVVVAIRPDEPERVKLATAAGVWGV